MSTKTLDLLRNRHRRCLSQKELTHYLATAQAESPQHYYDQY